jgi:sugar/nucleoside kinase (ribokinase family)
MGKKTRIAKASLAAAFVAAGGAAATQARAAANPDDANVEGVVSSYFGPLGLRDDFQQYIKESSGFQNFEKWWKFDVEGATRGVVIFSFINKIAPPPGFNPDGGPGL